MSKRIVVTGMGAVSPLGCGVEPIWQRLLAGQSGIATLPAELIGDLPISIGGQVPDRVQDPQAGFDPDLLLAAKEQRKMDRFILFALAAAQEALAQAGWAPQSAEAQERTATVIASGVGGFHAIAEAVRTTDGKVSSDFNDSPERASRPFDQARDGFVMGEGAGLLVIEELEHALARGARPIAELVGYGTSSDAYHMTAGPEDGSGARRAMQQALRQAGVEAAAVQHLNAHATSTQVGDKGELAAIKAVFGAGSGLAISATKSATGHLLGAAGGIEAIFTVLALRDQLAPATLNLETPDTDAEGLDLVRGEARRWPMEHALSNGFGFGGVNASLLFRRWV